METNDEKQQTAQPQVDAVEQPVQPETQPMAEPQPEPQEDEVDLDALVEEAERRGYLRGRNEAIGQVKRKLSQWEVPRVAEPSAPEAPSQPTILAYQPRSVWDQ